MSGTLDVVVIGASPGGLSLAKLLAEQGQRVMIFDGARCICAPLEDMARRHGLVLALDEKVSAVRRHADGFEITTPYATYHAPMVVMAHS